LTITGCPVSCAVTGENVSLQVSEPAFRIPLERLRLPPPIPAGFSPLRLYAIADALRNHGGDVREPAQVRRLDGGDWLVVEGRHRYLASWIAGCSHLLCREVD
jgi:hypothetical protein